MPSSPSASLYRVVWRWHFYAGLLVSPILLVVTITGALYIFRQEVEDLARSRLRFVEPGPSRLGVQAAVDLAAADRPGERPVSVELRPEPGRSLAVHFGRGEAATTVHVDPYRGRVLGAIRAADDPVAASFDLILDVHRRLFLGTPGRLIVELTAGWTILLLGTGLYLWWPDSPKSPGVWLPRLRRAKPYVLLRDLHTIVGFYLLAPMVVIVVTGLFYAPIWGPAFNMTTDALMGATPARPKSDPAPASPGPKLPLDHLVGLARDRYPGRILWITLPEESARTAKLGAANDYNNSYGPYVSAQFELDRADGAMTSHETLAESPEYWWHGWVYPLHVGSVMGPTSKVLWLLACLILIGLPITGLWMWWIRRPAGRTGFPRRPDREVPRWLIAMIAALGVILPVAGASMLAILAGEWLIARLRRPV